MNRQLGILTGFLPEKFEQSSIFHCILWLPHKSIRPVRSVSAVGILEVGKAIDKSQIISSAFSELLDMQIGI